MMGKLPPPQGRECLVLSDCQKKLRWDRPQPAIKLYDGMFVRVVRKHRPKLPILFISGKYGLITANQTVDYYEQRLPSQVTQQWVDKFIVERWIKLTGGKPDAFDCIWHNCSGIYRRCLEELSQFTTVRSVVFDEEELPVRIRHAVGVRNRYLGQFCDSRGGTP